MTNKQASQFERTRLEPFYASAKDPAPRDVQHLMAYPFFSLSKSHRVQPIEYAVADVAITVEAVREHGMATIWDADILIWAASQIIEARDAGLPTSRLLTATPYEILTYIGRGVGMRDYQRLRAALDRLQSTTVSTTLRQPTTGRRHRFSWINEWIERCDHQGRPAGIELIVPDWFYTAVLDDILILTIDRAYFSLTGGFERWLYRIVRKHGGRQRGGWRFEFHHLHLKSGSLSPFKRFAFELRDIVRRQPLPGYTLSIEIGDKTVLAFKPCGQTGDGLVLSGTRPIVPSGTGVSCYREPKPDLTSQGESKNHALNSESNTAPNFFRACGHVEDTPGEHGSSTASSRNKDRVCFHRGARP